MTPTLGCLVHYIPEAHGSSDAGWVPSEAHYVAIVSRVLTETCVNLVAFPQGSPHDHEDCGLHLSVILDPTALQRRSWHYVGHDV